MKTNYINQLQRQLMQDENFHCMPDDEQPIKSNTPIVEDVSMKDAANNFVKYFYAKPECENEHKTRDKEAFYGGWQQREQQLLPIIKELGEALKEIDEANNGIGVINTNWLKEFTKTTLEKYKNYL